MHPIYKEGSRLKARGGRKMIDRICDRNKDNFISVRCWKLVQRLLWHQEWERGNDTWRN